MMVRPARVSFSMVSGFSVIVLALRVVGIGSHGLSFATSGVGLLLLCGLFLLWRIGDLMRKLDNISQFHHLIGREPEKVGGIGGNAEHDGKQVFSP